MSTTALSQEKIAEITEELREKFFLFDLDGNNVMNTNELGAVMRSFGVNLTEEEISNLMKELDSDGSEVLEFGEFLRLMENTDRIDMLIKRKLKEGQIEDKGLKGRFVNFNPVFKNTKKAGIHYSQHLKNSSNTKKLKY